MARLKIRQILSMYFNEAHMSTKALERHLEPLKPLLEKDGVTEICINHPGGVFVERTGRFEYEKIDELS